MRHLLVVILLLMAGLVATVTGCRGTRVPDDARLVAADSLLASAPDSTLALVEALALDSLSTDGDRAYRDLLLTQARYKCYITATSDSDINRALGYYRAHSGEQEKLTRAYIYKGAVMEELGHPDSAMFYYKHAEATAAPDDYFNLGYVNLRTATLYANQYSEAHASIVHFKEALHFFKLLNDSNYLISCYGGLGAAFGTSSSDSAEYYLTKAINLSQHSFPDKYYSNISKLAGLKYYVGDYYNAKLLAMQVLHEGADNSFDQQFYYYAAMSYLYCGQLDSAKFVLNKTPLPQDNVDSMNYFNAVAEIAKAEKDFETYSKNAILSKGLNNRIINESKENQLIKEELLFDKQLFKQEKNHVRDSRNKLILITVVIIFILSIGLLIFWMTVRRHQNELAKMELELSKTIENLKNEQTLKETLQNRVSALVDIRIEALSELFDTIKFQFKDKKDKKRSIMPLSSMINGMTDYFVLMKVNLNDRFWEKMKLSVDEQYKGIASYVEREYPQLTEKENKMFVLFCTGLSPQIIKLCMNYSNPKSVTNFKINLIRQKMGLNMSFDEFLKQYMEKQK